MRKYVQYLEPRDAFQMEELLTSCSSPKKEMQRFYRFLLSRTFSTADQVYLGTQVHEEEKV